MKNAFSDGANYKFDLLFVFITTSFIIPLKPPKPKMGVDN